MATNVMFGSTVRTVKDASGNVVGLSAWSGLNIGLKNSYSVAFGPSALVANTTGDYCVAIGNNALKANTTGQFNIGIGSGALFANTTGQQNVALGSNSLSTSTTASFNTAVGHVALQRNTSGNLNTAVGNGALNENTTGTSNTAIGYLASRYGTTGTENVAIGSSALTVNVVGIQNTAIGTASLQKATSSGNTAVGAFALGYTTTGSLNVATGRAASWYNETGTGNVVSGWRAGYANLSGSYNVASGYSALHYAVATSWTVAIGAQADYLYPITASTTGTPTAGAGLGTGQYNYKVTFVLDGVETSHSEHIITTTTSGNNQMSLANLPVYVGPKTCTARKLYRTKVGIENVYWYLAEIADNTTTTYLDSTADASLTVAPTSPNYSIMLGFKASAITSNQFVVGSVDGPITEMFIGEGVYSTTPADIAINATGGSGTNVAGANLVLAGGIGTGSASGGDLIVKRTAAGSSGTAGNALAEVFRVTGNTIRVANSKTPSSASDTGVAGDICWDSNYVYVCTATNTWKRVAIATW